jgi:acetyl-CoA acetyltransferase
LKTGDFSTPIIPFLNQQGIRLLSELQRRKAKRGIVSICIGGGMGSAGLNN